MGSPSPSIESKAKNESEDVCNVKFERWLCDTVKLGQYLSAFRKSECNDIRMIEFFEEDAIKNEIGISKLFHRKLIMKKAKEFKMAQNAFSKMLAENAEMQMFKEPLESQGIVTLEEKKGEKCIDAFWNIISSHT